MLRTVVETWFLLEGCLAISWAAFFGRFGWLESVWSREAKYMEKAMKYYHYAAILFFLWLCCITVISAMCVEGFTPFEWTWDQVHWHWEKLGDYV